MHDLVHDVAFSILKSETLILDANLVDDVSHVRCLFIQSDGLREPRIPFTTEFVMNLRTFVSENVAVGGILSNFKCLYTLRLSGYSIKEFPDSIGQLIHLRLFCISHTLIEVLPKSITTLYNLQTLRVQYCHRLKELPEDLRNFINLIHIYIEHCDIKRTP